MLPSPIQKSLQHGIVIPATPMALNAQRQFDERRERALLRYYFAAGAGGIAVGVHTTQFEIRDPRHGLYRPVLALAADELRRADVLRSTPLVRVAGICGTTEQAVREAGIIRELGYHLGLLSLAACKGLDDDALVRHCQAVGEIVPIFGFYLHPGAGGRILSYRFWRRFAELDALKAIKIAAFNRYQTLDVLRAIAESGRDDIALYTGNDDNIVLDLVTPHRFHVAGKTVERRFVGGLLGHWAVWTNKAVDILAQCHAAVASGTGASEDLLRLAIEVTDMNAVLFDAANAYHGCIPGVHEVLRRQGLFEGTWCLNPAEVLSPGQSEEIDRIRQAYPHQLDDDFIARNRDEWLR